MPSLTGREGRRRLSPGSDARTAFRELAAVLKRREPAALLTRLPQESGGQEPVEHKVILLERYGDTVAVAGDREAVDAQVEAAIAASFGSGRARFLDDQGLLIDVWCPEPRLIVLGAGHIAKALVPLASLTGFPVIVLDRRPELATPERFPDAVEVVCEPFAEAIARLEPDSYAFVLVVTSNHEDDVSCLEAVLATGAGFIALVSSPQRAGSVRRKLLDAGLPADRVGAVASPAGIAIGAITPAEIAVSILAQMISVARLGKAGAGEVQTTRQPWPDVDYRLLDAIVEEGGQGADPPAALATVLTTAGPTSRGAGARMLIHAGGGQIGSVGGGLLEAMAIRAAAEVIAVGGWRLVRLDSGGGVDGSGKARLAQACGGSSVVLVESLASAARAAEGHAAGGAGSEVAYAGGVVQ